MAYQQKLAKHRKLLVALLLVFGAIAALHFCGMIHRTCRIGTPRRHLRGHDYSIVFPLQDEPIPVSREEYLRICRTDRTINIVGGINVLLFLAAFVLWWPTRGEAESGGGNRAGEPDRES
jgi:hypothetical protein